MRRRSPARFLAPIALICVAIVLFAIMGRIGGGSESSSTHSGQTASTKEKKKPARSKSSKAKRVRKTYVVKTGDTPSSIAVKTGVPLDVIQRLNPDIDPQLLAPGTRLKLRQ